MSDTPRSVRTGAPQTSPVDDLSVVPVSNAATAIAYCEANLGEIDGKTANGLVRHSELYGILAVIDSMHAGSDAGEVLGEGHRGIPVCRDLASALSRADTVPKYFVYGVAPASGMLSSHERGLILEAMSLGMNIVNGLHEFLNDDPEFASAGERHGVRILDVRAPRAKLERLRNAGVHAPMHLIRSPMMSELRRVVESAEISLHTELNVIRELSKTAKTAGRVHGVLLMVELGDLREGIMPEDLESIVEETLRQPNVHFAGLGANLACRAGVVPDATNMKALSLLADTIDATFGLVMGTISGGNSANLGWALSGADTGRVNNLRLGEAILLGRDPLNRQPIRGLHLDAFTLVAEVIESKVKPSLPWGQTAQNAFGEAPRVVDRGQLQQAILAVGQQDCDPQGLTAPNGIEITGASSDHLVVYSGPEPLKVGAELRFDVNYSALLRSMTSPFVAKDVKGGSAKGRSWRPAS